MAAAVAFPGARLTGQAPIRVPPPGAPACNLEPGPAVDRLRAIVKATRAKDYPDIRREIVDNWTTDQAAASAREAAIIGLGRLSLHSEGLSELRLCTQGRTQAVAGLRNEVTGAASQIIVEVEDSPAARLRRVTSIYAGRLIDVPPPPASDEEGARLLDQYVSRLAAHDQFSGVVIVAHHGRPLLTRAVGLADRERHIPITAETVFNLASLNKIMTAVAILQLVQDGMLSLDDSVAGILPDTSTDPAFRLVKVKHLLSHTSGLDADRNHLDFTPGTSFQYSNLGFRILGEIIAAKTAMRYEDYLRLKVLAPSGMTNTGRFEVSRPTPFLTTGYTLESLASPPAAPADHLSLTPNPMLQTFSGGAMGGLYSTGPDLLKFATALLEGRLLNPETVAMMRQPKVELGAPASLPSYGFGVMLDRTPGVWGHGGLLPGADTALEIYNDDYIVIVLANEDDVAAPILLEARALFNR
jgi:CubicO group peptidase (beta-lactamase class C family)